MELLIALIVLLLVVSFTKSVFWAVVYILAACLVLWAYNRSKAGRL